MSEADLPVWDLLQLAAECAGALIAIAGDVESGSECELPLPDDVEKKLREHTALVSVLSLVKANAQPEDADVLDKLYLEALPASSGISGVKFPLLPETAERIKDALEAIRLASLRDRTLASEIELQAARR